MFDKEIDSYPIVTLAAAPNNVTVLGGDLIGIYALAMFPNLSGLATCHARRYTLRGARSSPAHRSLSSLFSFPCLLLEKVGDHSRRGMTKDRQAGR